MHLHLLNYCYVSKRKRLHGFSKFLLPVWCNPVQCNPIKEDVTNIVVYEQNMTNIVVYQQNVTNIKGYEYDICITQR